MIAAGTMRFLPHALSPPLADGRWAVRGLDEHGEERALDVEERMMGLLLFAAKTRRRVLCEQRLDGRMWVELEK